MISLIVAVSQNGVIGKNNALPWKIPNDLRRFKELTTNHKIILGKNTYDSIGKALPNRINIVITRQKIEIPDCIVVHSVEDVLLLVEKDEEAFVIGGSQIYKLFLPYANKLYVTRILQKFDGDTFFDLDLTDWNRVSKEDHAEEPIPYCFEVFMHGPMPKKDAVDKEEVETIEVKEKPLNPESKIGSKEFCEELTKLLSDGKLWRTSFTLSEKLGVDTVQLDTFLRKQECVVCRAAKEEGIFLYALVSRFKQQEEHKREEKHPPARLLVSEEDRYAVATIHSAFVLLEAALKKYALKIHERNPEAFTNLVSAKEKLESGMVLYMLKVQADSSKLIERK